jgi:hypothetical protein
METTDGSRAWKMLQRQRIQMVLTDWMIPMTCYLIAGPVATQPPRSSSRPGQVRLQRQDRYPDGLPDSEVLEFPLLAHSVDRRGAYAQEGRDLTHREERLHPSRPARIQQDSCSSLHGLAHFGFSRRTHFPYLRGLAPPCPYLTIRECPLRMRLHEFALLCTGLHKLPRTFGGAFASGSRVPGFCRGAPTDAFRLASTKPEAVSTERRNV